MAASGGEERLRGRGCRELERGASERRDESGVRYRARRRRRRLLRRQAARVIDGSSHGRPGRTFGRVTAAAASSQGQETLATCDTKRWNCCARTNPGRSTGTPEGVRQHRHTQDGAGATATQHAKTCAWDAFQLPVRLNGTPSPIQSNLFGRKSETDFWWQCKTIATAAPPELGGGMPISPMPNMSAPSATKGAKTFAEAASDERSAAANRSPPASWVHL